MIIFLKITSATFFVTTMILSFILIRKRKEQIKEDWRHFIAHWSVRPT